MPEINLVYLLLAVILLLVICLVLLVVLIVKANHRTSDLAHVVYQQSDLVVGTHLERSQARISSLKDSVSKALMMIYRHNQKSLYPPLQIFACLPQLAAYQQTRGRRPDANLL